MYIDQSTVIIFRHLSEPS